MRKIIIVILFIFMMLPSKAEDVLYLDKKWDKEASRLLYEFASDDLKFFSGDLLNDLKYTEEDSRAVFYDLNSDGVNEIIGYIKSRYYYGVLGWQLFILQKNNDGKDVNMSGINFYPEEGLHILKDKTNGFYELGFYEGLNRNYRVLKYNNK